MEGDVRISLKSDMESSVGTISGTGSLSFHVSDASTMSLGLNYESPDSVVLEMISTTGIKIGNRDLEITVGGELMSETKEISGNATVKLRISKEVAASISQKLSKGGGQTALTVTVTF